MEGRSVSARQGLNESACVWVVVVDETVTEIADPKFAFHERKAPWGVEVAVGDKAPQEITTGIKHIDKAVAGTGDVILPRVIL